MVPRRKEGEVHLSLISVCVGILLSPSPFSFSSVQPNTSFPIYWKSGDLPFAFYFRPGSTEGYAWSGPVIASEEFAGQNWISLYNGISTAPPGNPNKNIQAWVIGVCE